MIAYLPEIVMVGLGVGAAMRVLVGPVLGAVATGALVGCGFFACGLPGIDALAALSAGALACATALADVLAQLSVAGRRPPAPATPSPSGGSEPSGSVDRPC